MTFWGGLKYSYRESWAFILACPLLFLVPVLAEFAQHIAEMQIGMYDSPAAAQALENDPLRMALGFIKTLALALPGYWVTRYLAGGRDVAAARTIDPVAIRLFAWVFAFNAILVALQLFVLPRTATAQLASIGVSLVLIPLLVRWIMASPLGIAITPMRSIREMLPQLPWAILFSLAVALPLMIPHYALGAAAIFGPGLALKWAILLFDSLLVGWLAAALIAGNWVIATRKMPISA